ncbi:DUF1634 domain-containing protein [Bdellovibrio svalbardensis]|uniref:DUF1634 domain-containing protein n=1 Tax=Bdellovibrio svalbardensis TaxID=2972972 RepID=A0ABT6DIR1_9BACT|nr:DUF1634 domain-containing protein [Bdellovibrio svalbardensis]MDG0816392.1 DUF1634 domain-containing protein [Bdellovibrio svalbardensis]
MRTDPAQEALHKLELTISHLLRIGVLLAGMFLLIGWLWLWFANGSLLGSFTVYESKSLFETIHWALLTNDRPMVISILGLILLVCLPVVRVFLTGVLFVKQKDFRLAIMAFLVFVALVASFVLGIDL